MYRRGCIVCALRAVRRVLRGVSVLRTRHYATTFLLSRSAAVASSVAMRAVHRVLRGVVSPCIRHHANTFSFS